MSEVVHDESVKPALVHTSDLDQLVEQVTTLMSRHTVIPARAGGFTADVSGVQTPGLSLLHMDYGMPLRLRADPLDDYVAVCLPLSGSMTARHQGRRIEAVAGRSALVGTPESELVMDWDEALRLLVLRIDLSALRSFASRLVTSAPEQPDLRFDPAMEGPQVTATALGQARMLQDLLAGGGPAQVNPLVAAQLREQVMFTLLLGQPNTWSPVLRTPGTGPSLGDHRGRRADPRPRRRTPDHRRPRPHRRALGAGHARRVPPRARPLSRAVPATGAPSAGPRRPHRRHPQRRDQGDRRGPPVGFHQPRPLRHHLPALLRPRPLRHPGPAAADLTGCGPPNTRSKGPSRPAGIVRAAPISAGEHGRNRLRLRPGTCLPSRCRLAPDSRGGRTGTSAAVRSDGDMARTATVQPTADPDGGASPDRFRQLEDQVQGLSQALHSRDIIGQAKGVLIAHLQIDADAAFAVLVRCSQHTNTRLAEIAAVLVTRVRDRGPAPHGRSIPAVLEELLTESRAAASGCPQPNLRGPGRRPI